MLVLIYKTQQSKTRNNALKILNPLKKRIKITMNIIIYVVSLFFYFVYSIIVNIHLKLSITNYIEIRIPTAYFIKTVDLLNVWKLISVTWVGDTVYIRQQFELLRITPTMCVTLHGNWGNGLTRFLLNCDSLMEVWLSISSTVTD